MLVSISQDVFKKVSGRDIHRLIDITYISTVRIIVLASYLYVTILLLVSKPKISRCLRESIRTVHTDYGIFFMYVRLVEDVSKKVLGQYISLRKNI